MTWQFAGVVLRWVDGDTFVTELDLGLGVIKREVKGALCRVRLLGLDAPELRSAEGPAAKALVEDLVPVGSVVWIESHALDNFGRVLGTVTLADGRRLLDLVPVEWIVT